MTPLTILSVCDYLSVVVIENIVLDFRTYQIFMFMENF